MDKLLFVHGLASSGAYKLANTLRILLKPAAVLSPDFPIEPDEALSQLRSITDQEAPDLVIGLSWGGFLVQQLRGTKKALINPDFSISRLLETMMGEVPYLSPRADGALSFTVTPELCQRYRQLETFQFDGIDQKEKELTLGFFAQEDELVHCQPLFEEHYPGRSISYPGGHLPTFPQVKQYILPHLLSFCHE